MSYILDALKKSDRERQQEILSDLQHLYETPPSSGGIGIFRRRSWPWFLLFGLLILGGFVKLFGWNQSISSNPPGPAGETLPQPAPAPTEMAAHQEPVGQTSPSSMPADAENGRPSSPLTVQAEWFDDWFQFAPKKDYSLSSEGIPPGEVEGQELPPVAPVTASRSTKIPKPVKIKRNQEKIVKVPPEETTVIRQPPVVPAASRQSLPTPSVADRSEPVPTVNGQPEPVPISIRRSEPAPSGNGQSVPSVKSKSTLPYLHDLSPQVQAEIPKLHFAGHAYAMEPSQRLIVINGAIMREGDHIDATMRLAEITWEGVIIDRKGVRFQVKCY